MRSVPEAAHSECGLPLLGAHRSSNEAVERTTTGIAPHSLRSKLWASARTRRRSKNPASLIPIRAASRGRNHLEKSCTQGDPRGWSALLFLLQDLTVFSVDVDIHVP